MGSIAIVILLQFSILRLSGAFLQWPVSNVWSAVSASSAAEILLRAKKPTFNQTTQKWERASDDDGKYPYDALGALLRHGPAPFLTRLTNPSEYEQGVLKYMASTGVSRAEATGNMDAKLNNAADWAFQKLAEKKGAPKVDYTRLDKKEAALVIIWALGITPLVISVIGQTISQYEGPHHPNY